jgi:hypothetical protein
MLSEKHLNNGMYMSKNPRWRGGGEHSPWPLSKPRIGKKGLADRASHYSSTVWEKSCLQTREKTKALLPCCQLSRRIFGYLHAIVKVFEAVLYADVVLNKLL